MDATIKLPRIRGARTICLFTTPEFPQPGPEQFYCFRSHTLSSDRIGPLIEVFTMAKGKELSGFEQMMEDIRTGNHNGGLMTPNVCKIPNRVLLQH